MPGALSSVSHRAGENPRDFLPRLPPYRSPKYGALCSVGSPARGVEHQDPTPHRQSFSLTEYPLHSQGSSKKQFGVGAAQAPGGKLSPPLQMGYEMPPVLLTAPPVGSPVHLWKRRLR